ncbi:MAG TPA: hypothetical protein VN214_08410 [Pseudomonas sp.]|nr:hypothetical protein [Pseudomonas sp.]
MPADLHISRTSTESTISRYYLPPLLVERLPEPHPETGIRTINSRRRFVDLVEGGTVQLGIDDQGHFRATQMSELLPSGPRIERVGHSSKWRRMHPESRGSEDSELIITRPPHSSSEPWADWGISAQHASPHDIKIEGVHYKTLPRGDAPFHPIVYIKNPAHMVYDFDLLHSTLRQTPEQQPRGAIQVPPTDHWQVDPKLPFDLPLTDYVATYFPELSETSLLNVAKKQFVLANGSDTATNAGLTTLRQVFNDWKSSGITPQPELADPLLMLTVSPITKRSAGSRMVELPLLSEQMPLQQLVFDPKKFRTEWQYFTTAQSAVDIKRFMFDLLTRNGYTVFKPTSAQSHPALVFQRTGHDFVFYMTLHRVHGQKIHLLPSSDQGFAPDRALDLLGMPALRAVRNAEAANKLIWLKGGSQFSADRPDSVFIVRTDDPRPGVSIR